MKKFITYSLIGMFTFSCSTSGSMINANQDFIDLEREYKSFSAKSLSDAYVKRMFGKYLANPVNPTHLTRQLEFSRFLKNNGDSSYETSLINIFSETPALYDSLIGLTVISDKMLSESATFGNFVTGLSPYVSAPVATSATDITESSFTANWNTVSRATSYKLYIDGSLEYSGLDLNFNKTGLTSGSTHFYYIKAVNSAGTSQNSNTINVTLNSGFYTVSAYAGIPTLSGYLDRQATNSTFSRPNNIDIDSGGNMYIADWGNHRIRKIDTNQNVTTVAGSGTAWKTDARGTSASFNFPHGVAVDGNGNIYVADRGNSRIRKIDSSGYVTTVAGNYSGFMDGQGTNARFASPRDIEIDVNGNIYVVDEDNNCIRKIDINRNVTTIAGGGATTNPVGLSGYLDAQGTNARFFKPAGIDLDINGNIYVADAFNHRIRKIDTNRNVTTIAGNGTQGHDDGQGTNTSFNAPNDITVDINGNLYLVDSYNETIRKIDTNFNVTTIAGLFTSTGTQNGQGTNARFYHPFGITLSTNGNLFVADSFNHTIRKITH